MSNLQILKNRADLLYKDAKTLTVTKKEMFSSTYEILEYHPKHFDVESLFKLFGYDENRQKNFKLSKAQHMIAQLAGKKNWQEVVKTPDEELRLPSLLVASFKNADDVRIWHYYKETNQYDIEHNYEESVTSFINGEITAEKVLIDRYAYMRDDFSWNEDFMTVEELPDGQYYASISLDGIPYKAENIYGKTPEEARDKAARSCLSIVESTWLIELTDPYQNLQTYGYFLDLFKEKKIITNYSVDVEECSDENGKSYYSCRCSCKRLFKNLSFVEESYDEEEAIYLSQEALYEALIKKDNC